MDRVPASLHHPYLIAGAIAKESGICAARDGRDWIYPGPTVCYVPRVSGNLGAVRLSVSFREGKVYASQEPVVGLVCALLFCHIAVTRCQ
jgi:hypothetical protein